MRRSTKNTEKVGEAAAEEDTVTPGSNMDALITQALRNGNYRLAIRYHYLKCLHRMAERGLVQYAVDKTNYQYVQEVSNSALRNDFAGITLHYEYVWYGEFTIDETIYRKLETGFNSYYVKI
jgi:hypothetical protein